MQVEPVHLRNKELQMILRMSWSVLVGLPSSQAAIRVALQGHWVHYLSYI